MNELLEHYRNRFVVVTGCSSGMGSAVARALTDARARVIGIDCNPPSSELEQFLRTDIGNRDSIESTLRQMPDEIWALFNCAGLSGGAADAQMVLRVNFIGLRELLDGISIRVPPGGAITSTSSVAAKDYRDHVDEIIDLVRTPGFDAAARWADQHDAYVRRRGGYQVAKEALILLTLDRCVALGERGIRINCVAPGTTDTPMLIDTAKVYGQELLQSVPQSLGRMASPEEQALILIFLNSNWASYITGETIWSDGGGVHTAILPA